MEYSDIFEFYTTHTKEKEILVKKLLELIHPQPHQTFLDLGCGNGAVTIPLSTHFKQTVAVDNDPMILTHLDNSNITFIQSSIEALPIDSTYDVVLMSYVLYGLTDWIAAIKQALRRVTPGGMLVIVYGGDTSFDVTRFHIMPPRELSDTLLRENLDKEGIAYRHYSYHVQIRTRNLDHAYLLCAIFFSSRYKEYLQIEHKVKDYLKTIAHHGEYVINNRDHILVLSG